MSTIIFTDGSSRGNPGPGGWGAIVSDGKHVQEIGGRESQTTNNRMELSAAIEALRIAPTEPITILSDSEYVIKGITEWIEGWIKRGWKNSQKKPVLNQDLWERLYEVTRGKEITWKYVRGHVGTPGNERCDVIATSFADNEKIDLYKGSVSEFQISLKF
jgi:ribonuclease HI